MNFRSHILKQPHSFLSPSSPSWLGYSDEKIRDVLEKNQARARGTALHFFAKKAIELQIKLPNTKLSLHQFVNDAIGFRMIPEQPLYYSNNAFGTTDCISFRDNLLRIHDLKTGASRVHMGQLQIYAALFCLEYEYQPSIIDIELRIYQSSKILVYVPESTEIRIVMEKIIHLDKVINSFKTDEWSMQFSENIDIE